MEKELIEVKPLIEIKQLPIIEEQLKNVSLMIDEKIKNAKSLVCNEETVKTIKELRASCNREFKEFEARRKTVKNQIMEPYMKFEEAYKKYISDKYKSADKDLKEKIESVENELKAKKEQEIREYFEEYRQANNLDFINFEQTNINVTLSASKKNLKEQAKIFIDKIVDDLKLIETQEHKTEILVEYKQTLNVSNAITAVTNRFKAIEEEKKRQEKFIEEANKSVIIPKEKEETLKAPMVEENKKEEVLTLKFTVKATRTKLKELKQFLENGGYEYE